MSSDATRTMLLETAWNLLRRDPTAATMVRIAAEAGVSRQAVYLHFHSHAGLLLAVVRWIDEREAISERFQAAAAAGSARAVLEAYVRTWLDYLPQLHPVASFLARFHGDPEARAAWNDRMAELEKVYRRPLRALHRAGELRDGLSVAQALALVRAIVSVQTWHFLVHESDWKQDAAVHSILLAMRGAVLRT